MPNKRVSWKVDDEILPDFLEDSPFLPVWDHAEHKKSARPKPASIVQLLKSKPARLAYGVLLLLVILSGFRRAHVYDRLTGPSCYFRDAVIPDESWRLVGLDWSQYAYALYATDAEYLCNAVSIFDSLQQHGSKADRLLLYADNLNASGEDTQEGRLLAKARDDLGVNTQPIQVLHEKSADYSGPNWADSYTKLLAFNQTQYSRVIVIDSDSLLLDSLDELFLLPPAPAVMPRAYWLSKPQMSSQIMVLTPSAHAFHDVQATIRRKAGYGFYDMEIMNYLFGRSCQVIPHQTYDLLTGEFRSLDHTAFLGSQHETGRYVWDPDVAFREAKMVHFSDHPLPKPWVATDAQIMAAKPACSFYAEVGKECRAQDIWMDIYKTFKEQRARVCV